MKKCSKCGETKALEEFTKCAKSKDGRQGKCKQCQHEYERRPEARKRRRELYKRSDARKKKFEYQQRPEVQKRRREYQQRPDVRKRKSENERKRRQRPEVQEKAREYQQRPDVRKRKRENMCKYRENNHDKVRVRMITAHAIKTGEIIKSERCSRCGSTVDIQGHHEDYDKPLDVIWLCRSCHMRRHRKDQGNA